jgi:hypothetical protein
VLPVTHVARQVAAIDCVCAPTCSDDVSGGGDGGDGSDSHHHHRTLHTRHTHLLTAPPCS